MRPIGREDPQTCAYGPENALKRHSSRRRGQAWAPRSDLGHRRIWPFGSSVTTATNGSRLPAGQPVPPFRAQPLHLSRGAKGVAPLEVR